MTIKNKIELFLGVCLLLFLLWLFMAFHVGVSWLSNKECREGAETICSSFLTATMCSKNLRALCLAQHLADSVKCFHALFRRDWHKYQYLLR